MECGNGFGMIFVSATLVVNFVCAGRKGGQFGGINALMTTQEGVRLERTSRYGIGK